MSRKNVWGILLILLGTILGLNALEITNIDIFFDGWWTLLIIIPSISGLLEKEEDKKENIIGIIIGLCLLLACQGILNLDLMIKLIIPFIFITMGVSFLFGEKNKEKITEKMKEMNKENSENIISTFSEQKINKENETFKGGNLDAIFGGITLDLRKANLEKETWIKVSCIFGGIDILLPDDVKVKVKATPIFGGVTNKLRNHKENKKTVYIDAFCMFGGVDIK